MDTPGEAAVDEVAAVLDAAEATADGADEVFGGGEGDVGEPAASKQGPDAFDGVEVGGVGRQVVDGQPFAGVGELAQAGGFVDVEVVPDEDDRAAELLVGGDQQVPVVAPGEALASVALAVVCGGAGRSAGTDDRVCSRSARRSRSVCGNGRGPAPPGCGRAVTRSWRAAASWRSRLRPRRPARPHEPPRAFRAGPHLLDPPGHGVVVAFHGPSGRDLAGPAVTDQQLAHPLDRVGQVEASADHGLDPAQGPALVLPAMRGRPLGQLRLQLGELLLTQPRQRRRPLRPQSPRTALVPRVTPSLHRPDTDPQVLGDRPYCASPRANRSAAWSRNSSRICLPFGGQPATLWIPHPPVIPQPATRRQPLRLHEFNLSNRSGPPLFTALRTYKLAGDPGQARTSAVRHG